MKYARRSCELQGIRKERPWLLRLGTVVYVIALVSFLGVAFLSRWEIVTRDEHCSILRITVLNPNVRSTITIFGAIGASGLFLAGVVWIRYRRIWFGTIAIVVALGGYCTSNIVSFLHNPAPWTTQAEILGPDGHAFYFMDSSFLQGQLVAMARGESATFLTRTMEVLGTNNGDSPRSWASVIRPVGAPEHDYGQLYATDTNMVIGIRDEYKCYLVYDTVSGRFYGHGDIEKISPFVLIGPYAPMHEADVEGVINEVRRGAKLLSGDSDIRIPAKYLAGRALPGYPRVETVVTGLTHANPAVRRVSRSILEIHENGQKQANERVAQQVEILVGQLASGDVNVRERAAEELGSIGGPGANPGISALSKLVEKDEDREVRFFASQSLGLIGEAAIPALLELLESQDESVRENAIFGLQMAGRASESAIPTLIENLKDRSPNIRARAAVALGNIGPAAKIAIPALTEAMEDESGNVQYFATKALKEIQE